MKMNLNDFAWVKLTTQGEGQYLSFYQQGARGMTYALACESLARRRQPDGRHRFQIWELMNIFGPKMFMTMNRQDQMFKGNEIEFVPS
jgi:hypothetical protein